MTEFERAPEPDEGTPPHVENWQAYQTPAWLIRARLAESLALDMDRRRARERAEKGELS